MNFKRTLFGTTAAATLAMVVSVGSANALPFLQPAQPGDQVTLKFEGLTTENHGVNLGASGGAETTWGVGDVTSITDSQFGSPDKGNILFQKSNVTNGQNLDFVLYGIADQSTSGTATPQNPQGTLFNEGATT